MSNILVTGGAGFIGSHTCISLLEKGHNLLILDNLSNSFPNTKEKIIEVFEDSKNVDINRKLKFRKADLRIYSDVYSIFQESKDKGENIESVIHFAGLKDLNASIKKPLDYWENNVVGTINLLKIMESFNCRTIVFSSSATIYDGNFKEKFKEDSPKLPQSPYGLTKLNIEKILYDLYKSGNGLWKIISLRYFNPAGAHRSGKLGESPLNDPTNLFPAITQVACGKKKKLNVFGADWPTYDGSAIRDYVHVMDVAEAHVMALDFLKTKRKEFITINLGSGKGTSVFEFIKKFEMTNNCKIPFVIKERREGDFAKLVADISLAKKILNWEPKRSISEICKDGWKWQRLNNI